MEGYRFYEEFWGLLSQNRSTGNVVAVDTNTYQAGEYNAFYEGYISKTETLSNGDVGAAIIYKDFLQAHCKRISEKRAREIHPKMFEYLESIYNEERAE